MNKSILNILLLIILLSFNSSILLTNELITKNNEIRITNSEYSETDPEIIVNPIDSNNLISSSIQHKLNYGVDHFINAISYSLDKGLTWNRYQKEVFPSEKYRMLSNARDNKIIFDSYGKAHLVWLTTLIKTGFGGIDSVIQLVTYRYSTNKGIDWNELDENIDRVKSNYDVSKVFNGLNETFSNLKLIEYNYNVYISYSVHSTYENKASINLVDLRNPKSKINIKLPSKFTYLGNYDLKIKDNKVHIAFLSNDKYPFDRQVLEYFVYDLLTKNIENHTNIAEVNFMGSTLIPGVISYVLPGLPTEFINPNPLINFINDTILLSWYGADYSKEVRFPKNNVYICKGIDGVFGKAKKVFRDLSHHQCNYDLKINDNGVIIVNYYNLEGPFESSGTKFNYNVEPRFTLSFDKGETFKNPITYVSNSFELTHTLNRNFKYGIGYKTGISIDNNDIYLTWTDGRLQNGNTEIYSSVYPIRYDLNKLFNKENIKINVNNIYPNPFSNQITIEMDNYKIQNINIFLCDYNGKIIKYLYDGHIKVGLNNLIFDLESIAEGNYFLNFKTDGEVIYKKLIKVN